MVTTIRGTILRDKWRDGTRAISIFRMINERGKLGDSVDMLCDEMPVADKEVILEATGEFKDDPKYGRQFKAVAIFEEMPTTVFGLEKYLCSRVSGVGPARAAKLVEHFGNDLFSVLDESWERMAEVPTISRGLAEKIANDWKAKTKDRKINIWLAEHGISEAYSRRIINHFGSQAIKVIERNPYDLTEVDGIGFKLADEFAQKVGWPTKSPQRTEAAIVFILEEATNKGHTFLHLGEIYEELRKTSGCTPEEADTAVQNAALKRDIVIEDVAIPGTSIRAVYLPYLHHAEKELAERLAVLVKATHAKPPKLEEKLKAVQEAMQTPLEDLQLEGVRGVFEHHVSVITGGPGTGKTTTLKAIIAVAEELGLNCTLAAPTGRAAKRMSEVTKREAKTIHRLLEFDPVEFSFRRHRGRPVEADILIVDEGSMLELTIGRALFDAVPLSCSVLVIGDSDQLPAVGPGSVLRDIIASNAVKVTRLTKVHRQAQGSRIIMNAHRIREGKEPQFPEIPGTNQDSVLVMVSRVRDERLKKSVDSIEDAKKKLISLIRSSIPKRLELDPIRDIQVLIPMKVGDAGVAAMNGILQEALNPRGDTLSLTRGKFRVGDRVMQMKNNYDLDIYNGDIGFIRDWDIRDRVLRVEFDNRTVEMPFESTGNLELAYAQTIHKSQGGEWPVVIVMMLSQHFVMLERNLIYTANTRAKRLCVFLATPWAIKRAVENAPVAKRNSFLTARIRGACQVEVI